MRKYRYILPIIVILLCFLSVFITVQRSKSQIIKMIDDAGSKGEPIVICNTWMDNSFMVTFNCEPVNLITSSFNWPSMVPFVSDSGEITFINTLDLPESPLTMVRKIMLPEIFSEKPLIENTPPEIDQFDFLSVSHDSKNIACYDNEYTILDLPDMDITTGEFMSPRPWLDAEHRNASLFLSVISSDGKIIIARGYSTAASSSEFWSYNIETGVWHKIIDGIGPNLFSVSPDGSIIGLELSDTTPPKTQFINASDGSVIHEVFQAKDAIIGGRWITLRENNTPGVILIDMQNNWEERRIALPEMASDDYTIWIPPPGGYDEMMENRAAESNSADSQ
ncbi:MAG: kelch repeat-containing protein [bacterium]|nr:kelch repeat-containing protein [bacterium]